MKKIATLTLLFLVLPGITFAQVREPKEVSEQMSAGKNTGWRLFIPHVDDKDVGSEWKKLMKDFESKVEKVKKSDDLLAASALVPAFGNTRVDIYVQIHGSSEGTYVTAFVAFPGEYLSSSNRRSESKEWERIMQNFGTRLVKEHLEKQVKAATKDLESEEKELDRLKKLKISYEKDIDEAEKTIKDRKNKISQNIEDQKSQNTKVTEKTNELEALKKELGKY